MINFFESNEDCPTCQQHIDEVFKSDMISQKKTEADKIQVGMKELKTELDKVSSRKKEIKEEELKENIRLFELQLAMAEKQVRTQ